MNIQNFIKNTIDTVKLSFPKSKISYQFIDSSDTHFIKISPKNIYKKEEFINLDCDLTDQFDSLFPSESFCFITDDALIELNAPTIVRYPCLPEVKIYNQQDILTGYELPVNYINMENGVSLNNYSNFCLNNIPVENILTNFEEKKLEYAGNELVGNTTFAMAA